MATQNENEQPEAAATDQESSTSHESGQLDLNMQAQLIKAGVFRRNAWHALELDSVPPDRLRGQGLHQYVDRELKAASDPSDPVERMMMEQLVLSHQRIAVLHRQANKAETWDHAETKNRAAARLLGEFRRLALALKAYREAPKKTPPKIEYHIGQQNISQAGGRQEVEYAKGESPGDVRMQSREPSADEALSVSTEAKRGPASRET